MMGDETKGSSSLCIEPEPPQTRLGTDSKGFDINDSDLTDGPLCARCASIDFEAALSSEQDVILIESLGLPSDWSISSCTFCKFLACLVPEYMREYLDGYLLRTISSHSARVINNMILLQALPPTKLLELYHKHHNYYRQSFYFVPQNEGFEPIRSLKTSSINFSVLKDWLDLCRTMHTRVCNAQGREPKTVEHFRLIDCHTRQIVTAQNVDYVTLSYVWGPTEECHEFSEQLPTTLPRTIEDAMAVTQKLGLRYIWIDRYCINQKQKGHAYLQMSQMDLIYQNSVVTIVAAAGEDPSYGLPGVSRRERRPQPRARIRSTVFIDSLPKTNSLISNSHWASRGWTYQEAILSRRRLAFTDDQVSFQCTGMHCYEAFQIPWESLHTSDRQSMEDKYLYLSGSGGELFPFGVGTTRNAIFNRISEYSRKSLTYQSDRLNAFLGILRVFETRGTYHCWGTPILPDSFAPGLEPSKQDLNLGFLQGLCWEPLGNFKARLQHFPSWSWTSWSDAVSYDEFPVGLTSVLKVSIELRDGSVLDWIEFQRRYAEITDAMQLSHFIHVWAPTFEIHNLSKENSHNLSKETSPWYSCEIKMNDGWFLRWKFLFYHDESMLSQYQKSFVMASYRESRKFIVFLKHCEDNFERLWGGWIHCENVSLLRPDRKEADGVNLVGSNIIERYGRDWERSIASTWETLRIG
ncbi:HET-domain-containing protein [Hyaloscypha hepaticicola]|uniref:HET-domain-containing protein n=1 Tax=Hyaloscypha hepaticicola TaxID=2082293 RepID=A0A2J6Q193_9HELO|nr:HET-domain-containing protein [Hyaloscypha hepaticicola]